MNKSILFIITLGLVTLFSCNKDIVKPIFDTNGTFTAPVVVTPGNNAAIVITAANIGVDSIKFKWSGSNYGLQLGVNYTLFVTPSGGARVALNSTNADSLTMAYSDFNTFLTTKTGLPAFTATPISIDVKSTLLTGNDSLVSPSINLTVTCYSNVLPPAYLYIAGAFQNPPWTITAAVPICSPHSTGVYDGYIYCPDAGGDQYKIYTQLGNWNSVSYGDSTNGDLVIANYAGDNFATPGPGYYYIGVNLNNMSWSQTLTTWSIIGDATPGGWSTDTQLAYSVNNQVWTVTCAMKASGSYKFRANDAWVIDFGVDNKGNLAYSDNPVWGYNANTNNITVPADGTYTITLNLSKAGAYTYTAVKN